MNFIEQIKSLASKNKKTIVLPESGDIRTLKAVSQILKEGFADVILLGDEAKINATLQGDDSSVSLKGAQIINPLDTQSPLFAELLSLVLEVRKHKGIDEAKAREMLSDSLYFGAALVKANRADGMVAGANHATSQVLRAGLQVVGTAVDTKLVSSFFVMVVPNCTFGHNGILLFADCALCQNPNADELAQIALSSAKSFEALMKAEPIVAMLSHSTYGSAEHSDIDKVREATRIAKGANPHLKVDGELQLDAAIVPSVGASKAKGSNVAGKANVLIFPDLDSGNIGYKLVQRLAKAEAYGPITQGMAAPINDLSRGCSAEDIVGVVAMSALQANLK